MKSICKASLFLAMFALAGCGARSCSSEPENSSISPSSAAPSVEPSSIEPTLPCEEIRLCFDAKAVGEVNSSGRALDAEAFIEDAVIDIRNDYPMESIGDWFDPTFYRVANLMGRASIGAFGVKTFGSHFENVSRITDVGFDFYSKESIFYWDLSEWDVPEFEIRAGKYYIEDFYSFLDNETISLIADLLVLVDITEDTFVHASEENDILKKSITVKTVDDETHRVEFSASNASLSAFAEYMLGVIDGKQIQDSMDELLDFTDKSRIIFDFDADSGKRKSISFDLGVMLKIEPFTLYEEIQINRDVTLYLSGEVRRTPCAEFELPSFGDFEPFDTSILSDVSAWFADGEKEEGE
ncbi:MAG: hypothetical protein SPL80_06945 [Bacilli bacterium]|nr:hypothetical protein [Bacilli bacterium]